MGENTDDNRLGLHLGQCVGTCDNAPQVWVNGEVVGPLTIAGSVELVRELQAGNHPAQQRQEHH
jgi:NADH:ubiquinone oxidoreductase subunit E